MRRDDSGSVHEIPDLFQALVRDLHESGHLLACGTESFSGPYVQIRSAPERRSLTAGVTTSTRTTVRLYSYGAYLRYLENSFPTLFEQLAAACRPGRPFLVVESWVLYVRLGTRLLAFARDHGLNLRCVDFQHGESRLNGVRVVFDHGRHRWRALEGSVEDLLRDPRSQRRSWVGAMDPRWPLGRTARRLNGVARRAAALALS
ncbi:MAG: hypothetical protein ABR599_06900 [Gemmatimonadota bacterium]